MPLIQRDPSRSATEGTLEITSDPRSGPVAATSQRLQGAYGFSPLSLRGSQRRRWTRLTRWKPYRGHDILGERRHTLRWGCAGKGRAARNGVGWVCLKGRQGGSWGRTEEHRHQESPHSARSPRPSRRTGAEASPLAPPRRPARSRPSSGAEGHTPAPHGPRPGRA